MNEACRSLNEKLEKLGHKPCKPLMARKDISVKDSGRVYRLEFTDARASVAYQIDGDIVREGSKCDYLILAEHEKDKDGSVRSWKEIFVELKGKDVVHAIEQLDSTVSMQIFRHPTNKELHARLIAKAIPSTSLNPEYWKAKMKFERDHKNIKLKTLKSLQPDRL